MSAATAIAFDCKILEKDPTPAESFTVDCARCDPDNPVAIPRKDCPDCGGSGQAKIALAAIVTEIHESRLELLLGGRSDSDPDDDASDGEYDEWCDPDDLC